MSVNPGDMWIEQALTFGSGKVFVFTGILPLCRNEDGIAAVLGHEIAHIVAHHTAYVSTPHTRNDKLIGSSERMSRAPLILLGAIGLMWFDLSLYSSKMLLDLVLSYPCSRKQEVLPLRLAHYIPLIPVISN